MNGNLFQSENLGRSQFYIWYGQVVGGSEWEDNQKDESISKHKIHTRDDVSGWGHRCKVAIMGYDPRIVTDDCVKNSELVMAEVMVPPTGGGGVGGPVITPTIGNNSFVVGFFKDGVSAREPVIMGILPNVSQSRLEPYDKPEKERYDASSGYKDGKQKGPPDPVANDALWLDGGGGGTPIMETGEMVRPATLMLKAQLDDGKRKFPMPQTFNCQKKSGPLEGVQLVLEEMANVINLSKIASGIGKASDALKNANAMITTATNVITSYVRGMMQDMRSTVLNFVNRTTQKVLDIFPPNIRAVTSSLTTNPLLDIITCAFNKALGAARGLVGSFLSDFIGGAVNTVLGAASSVLGSVLTGTLGSIVGAVSGALGTLSSLAGAAAGILSDPIGAIGSIAGSLLPGGLGGILSGAFGALDVVFGALNIFSCKDELTCGKVNAFSFLYGEAPFGLGAGGGKSAASATAAAAAAAAAAASAASLGTDTGSTSGTGTVIDTTIQSEAQKEKSNSAPILSGPPIISSSGGGTSPKSSIGNPIISPSGELLAIDFGDVGGFTSSPSIIISDPSGKGRGADVIAILEDGSMIKFDLDGCGNLNIQPTSPIINETLPPFTGKQLPDLTKEENKTELIGGGEEQNPPLSPLTPSLIEIGELTTPQGRKIKNIVIKDGGVGYLPYPDGSTGAGGQVFSNPEDTIIFCGGYNVYPPSSNVNVLKGNIVYLPLGTEGVIYDFEGEIIQSVVGRGPTNGIEVLESGILATPYVEREDVIPPQPQIQISTSQPQIQISTIPLETYEVALEIGDVYIDDPGINYSPDDEIVLEPSNGAVLEPKYDDGRLLEVKIINPGIGFTEFPVIKIPSTTGVRANIIPIFNIIRIDTTQTDQPPIPEGVELISVIDCVGIIPPKREFDIIPQ